MKNKDSGMSLIVKTITRVTAGLILVYGIYIVLQGHLSPGGGFAGGVIISLSLIHLVLAFGKDAVLKRLDQLKAIFLLSLGAVLFLFFISASFMHKDILPVGAQHFKIFSAGLMPLYDIAIALAVGMGLFVIFLALVMVTRNEGEE